ncbi:MAG TPA: Fe-S cluster assembly scaffold IscU [Polyangiaceae bacterium]
MYSKSVLDRTENPQNVGTLDSSDPRVGTGLVGSPACGDVMRLQIKVGDGGVIEAARFKTFGCGSAIAASSLATEWVTGRSLTDAAKIQNRAIAAELNLPPVKLHCSVLAEDAIRLAIEDYRRKQAALLPDGAPLVAEERLTAASSPGASVAATGSPVGTGSPLGTR